MKIKEIYLYKEYLKENDVFYLNVNRNQDDSFTMRFKTNGTPPRYLEVNYDFSSGEVSDKRFSSNSLKMTKKRHIRELTINRLL